MAAAALLFGLAMTLLLWNQIASGSGALRRLLDTATSEASNEQRREVLRTAWESSWPAR